MAAMLSWIGGARMNRKRKGSRNELKTKRYLEKEAGYQCTKAGGSLGAWDLIAIDRQGVLLVQVKSNRMPGPKERKRLQDFVAPDRPAVRKVIYIWIDHARKPAVWEWFPLLERWL